MMKCRRRAVPDADRRETRIQTMVTILEMIITTYQVDSHMHLVGALRLCMGRARSLSKAVPSFQPVSM